MQTVELMKLGQPSAWQEGCRRIALSAAAASRTPELSSIAICQTLICQLSEDYRDKPAIQDQFVVDFTEP